MKTLLTILALITLVSACNQQDQPNTGVSLHAELGGAAEGYELIQK